MMIILYSDRGASFIGMLALDGHGPIRMRPHSPERKATIYSTPLLNGLLFLDFRGRRENPTNGRTRSDGHKGRAPDPMQGYSKCINWS